MNIYIANLSIEVTDEDLRDLFSPYGTINSVKVIIDKETGKSKGFGFVEMPNEEEGQAAIEALNDRTMHWDDEPEDTEAKAIKVSVARPRQQNNNAQAGYRQQNNGFQQRRQYNGNGGFRPQQNNGGFRPRRQYNNPNGGYNNYNNGGYNNYNNYNGNPGGYNNRYSDQGFRPNQQQAEGQQEDGQQNGGYNGFSNNGFRPRRQFNNNGYNNNGYNNRGYNNRGYNNRGYSNGNYSNYNNNYGNGYQQQPPQEGQQDSFRPYSAPSQPEAPEIQDSEAPKTE